MFEELAERHPVAFVLTLVFGAVLAVTALAAFIWGLRTDFSYWWGQQGAIQEKNSTSNFISAQQGFLVEKNDVDGYAQKIVIAKAALTDFDARHPNLAGEDDLSAMQDRQERAGLADDLKGLQQQCVNTVNKYNVDAQAFLTADWRGAGLPDHLTTSDCGLG